VSTRAGRKRVAGQPVGRDAAIGDSPGSRAFSRGADGVRERAASGGLADHPHQMMALRATRADRGWQSGSWLEVVGGAHSGRSGTGLPALICAGGPQRGWR
jgi:hypothetical protein